MPKNFDIMKWLTQGSDGKNPHTKEAVDPIVEAGIQELKRQGAKKIGAVGYEIPQTNTCSAKFLLILTLTLPEDTALVER